MLPHSAKGGSGSSSWPATIRNLLSTGRLPLCILITLIVGFIVWQIESGVSQQGDATLALSLQQAEQEMIDHAIQIEQKQFGPNMNPRQRLPVKHVYRCLVVGDSLTVGYYWSPSSHDSHPYLDNLEKLLAQRHPNLQFEFTMDAQGGECVISTCASKSMIARVKDRLAAEREHFDLAILLGGTNDIYHDFDALDISHGLQTVHKLFWEHSSSSSLSSGGASSSATKTVALTIPQWGDSDSWRPPRRPSKLLPAVAAAARSTVNKQLSDFCFANSEQCTLVNLDEWFPRHTLTPRELERKWAEDVHPTVNTTGGQMRSNESEGDMRTLLC